jgi:hypothetical protein
LMARHLCVCGGSKDDFLPPEISQAATIRPL